MPRAERVHLEPLGGGFWRLIARFGFMQVPDVPKVLEQAARGGGFAYDPDHTTFFLGRETVLARHRHGMALWREKLFAFLVRNAQRPMAFFGLPPDRVLELGSQVEL